MDDTLLFIPPCCVDKKLPKAVLQAPRYMLTFYTHGDVTMEKFYRAVSFLLVSPHVMVVSMPAMSPDTLVFLQQCFERKWIQALVLSTARNCDELVSRYLGAYAARVLYARNKDVSDTTSHLVLYNKDKALTITGAMFDRPYASLECYSMMFYPNYSLKTENDWGNPLRNILFPVILRHRMQVHKEKRKVDNIHLERFLACELPPYKEDEEARPSDYYSFSNV